MPTVKEIRKAAKKLKTTKNQRMANKPMLPNASTLRVIKADPRIKRNKEALKAMHEAEMHRKQYINAVKKLKKIVG